MIAESFSFPPINSILRWQDLFSSFNKVALIAVAAAVIGSLVFILAGRKEVDAAPKGVRNLAEISVEFIENGIVMETIGRDGLGWTPFLLSLFVFVYLCNAPGIIPILQMPATARIAIPMFLALFVWVVYMGVGHADEIAVKLVRHGLAATTPVAVIQNGTLEGQQVVAGTLGQLAHLLQANGITNPAVFVIGEVARAAQTSGAASNELLRAVAG